MLRDEVLRAVPLVRQQFRPNGSSYESHQFHKFLIDHGFIPDFGCFKGDEPDKDQPGWNRSRDNLHYFKNALNVVARNPKYVRRYDDRFYINVLEYERWQTLTLDRANAVKYITLGDRCLRVITTKVEGKVIGPVPIYNSIDFAKLKPTTRNWLQGKANPQGKRLLAEQLRITSRYTTGIK